MNPTLRLSAEATATISSCDLIAFIAFVALPANLNKLCSQILRQLKAGDLASAMLLSMRPVHVATAFKRQGDRTDQWHRTMLCMILPRLLHQQSERVGSARHSSSLHHQSEDRPRYGLVCPLAQGTHGRLAGCRSCTQRLHPCAARLAALLAVGDMQQALADCSGEAHAPDADGSGTRCRHPPSSHTRRLAVSGFSHRGSAYAASISRNSPSLSHTLRSTASGQDCQRCNAQ